MKRTMTIGELKALERREEAIKAEGFERLPLLALKRKKINGCRNCGSWPLLYVRQESGQERGALVCKLCNTSAEVVDKGFKKLADLWDSENDGTPFSIRADGMIEDQDKNLYYEKEDDRP